MQGREEPLDAYVFPPAFTAEAVRKWFEDHRGLYEQRRRAKLRELVEGAQRSFAGRVRGIDHIPLTEDERKVSPAVALARERSVALRLELAAGHGAGAGVAAARRLHQQRSDPSVTRLGAARI